MKFSIQVNVGADYLNATMMILLCKLIFISVTLGFVPTYGVKFSPVSSQVSRALSKCCGTLECRRVAIQKIINTYDRILTETLDHCRCNTEGSNTECYKRCPPRQKYYHDLLEEEENLSFSCRHPYPLTKNIFGFWKNFFS